MTETQQILLLNSDYDAVRQRSYLALDIDSWEAAKSLVDSFGDVVTGYKVGLQLFHADGRKILEYLIEHGKRVFLDMKLHDIPNTVAGALRAICQYPIEMVNVHASGGRKMMEAARYAVDNAKHRPLLIAVTLLTSLEESSVREIGFRAGPDLIVPALAALAAECELDGVVASALEAAQIRAVVGSSSFEIVVPGTRLAGGRQHDQSRSLTPSEALRAGASRLVIGRSVLEADNCMQALKTFWDEMNRGIEE